MDTPEAKRPLVLPIIEERPCWRALPFPKGFPLRQHARCTRPESHRGRCSAVALEGEFTSPSREEIAFMRRKRKSEKAREKRRAVKIGT